MTDIVYSVKESRLKESWIDGFRYEGGTRLIVDKDSDSNFAIIKPIDGEELHSFWGRLRFDVSLQEDHVLVVHILCTEELIENESFNTMNALRSRGAKMYIGLNDILLYNIEGRYLYIGIEVFGKGDGYIDRICIDKIGDNFMNTFPDIYREKNSFFHRFMSVFSSVYNDFGEDIKSLPDLLDIDSVPQKYLITLGHWLGIDIDCDLQDENMMRTFVKEAYELNKIKGTKACVSRIAKIMLDEDVTILEKNIMEQFEDEREMEQFHTLFGKNVYNVCILVNERLSEVKKSQFMYILKQFVPIRAKIQIVNLKKEGELDYHSYLDMNAKLFESMEGSLDKEMVLDHSVMLIE